MSHQSSILGLRKQRLISCVARESHSSSFLHFRRQLIAGATAERQGKAKTECLKKKERNIVLFPPLYEIACQIIDWGLALQLCSSLSAAESASYLGPDVLPLTGLWGPGGLLANADSLCLVKDGANRRRVHVILTLRVRTPEFPNVSQSCKQRVRHLWIRSPMERGMSFIGCSPPFSGRLWERTLSTYCLLSSLCSYFLLITLPVSVHLLKLITDVNYKIIGWMGFPGGASGKESACQCRRLGFDPWFRKIPWRRAWQPTPVFLPGESHGQRSLVGYNPWSCTELDMTKCLSTIGWISIHPTPFCNIHPGFYCSSETELPILLLFLGPLFLHLHPLAFLYLQSQGIL